MADSPYEQPTFCQRTRYSFKSLDGATVHSAYHNPGTMYKCHWGRFYRGLQTLMQGSNGFIMNLAINLNFFTEMGRSYDGKRIFKYEEIRTLGQWQEFMRRWEITQTEKLTRRACAPTPRGRRVPRPPWQTPHLLLHQQPGSAQL
eukprot:6175618-Pleurochrysis_carterae.AAC.3